MLRYGRNRYWHADTHIMNSGRLDCYVYLQAPQKCSSCVSWICALFCLPHIAQRVVLVLERGLVGRPRPYPNLGASTRLFPCRHHQGQPVLL